MRKPLRFTYLLVNYKYRSTLFIAMYIFLLYCDLISMFSLENTGLVVAHCRVLVFLVCDNLLRKLKFESKHLAFAIEIYSKSTSRT